MDDCNGVEFVDRLYDEYIFSDGLIHLDVLTVLFPTMRYVEIYDAANQFVLNPDLYISILQFLMNKKDNLNLQRLTIKFKKQEDPNEDAMNTVIIEAMINNILE
eukprot:781724_1